MTEHNTQELVAKLRDGGILRGHAGLAYGTVDEVATDALMRQAADLIETQAAEIKRLTAERDGILSDLSEDQAEMLDSRAASRDNLRVMDYIADKIGLPHDVELDENNFCIWFDRATKAEAALAEMTVERDNLKDKLDGLDWVRSNRREQLTPEIEEGIKRAADLLFFAAANRDDRALAEEIWDLAADVLQLAPTHETTWKSLRAEMDRADAATSHLNQAQTELDAERAQAQRMREALEKCAAGYASLTTLLTGGPIYEGGRRVGMAALAIHSKAGEECARSALSTDAALPAAEKTARSQLEALRNALLNPPPYACAAVTREFADEATRHDSAGSWIVGHRAFAEAVLNELEGAPQPKEEPHG